MLVVLSLLLGLVCGLLAGGGSFLALPVFRYGFGEEAETAVPGALLVVALMSLVGTVVQARGGRLRWREGLVFAGPSVAAAVAGGWAAGFVPGPVRMVLFAGVLLYAGARRLFGERPPEEAAGGAPQERGVAARGGEGPPASGEPLEAVDARRVLATAAALGVVTGFLGYGAGVLVASSLAVLFRLSFKEAAQTSLLVVTLNASGGLAGHLTHATLPWARLVAVGALAACGCVAGLRVARRVPRVWIRLLLGWVIIALAAWMLWKEV